MGYLRDLKNQVKDAAALASDHKASAPSGPITMGSQEAPPGPPAILNPTPQAEVDHLLSTGGVTRGVVAGRLFNLEPGEHVRRMNVEVRVQPRWLQETLGPETKLTIWTSWQVAVLLDPGLEIPVHVDPVSRLVTAVDADALAEELRPRFDEARERHPAWGNDVAFELEGLRELPDIFRELFQPSPPPRIASADDPNLRPIDGIGWDAWASAKGWLTYGGLPGGIDATVEAFGIPADRWVSIDQQWTSRMMVTPELAEFLGQEILRAQKAARATLKAQKAEAKAAKKNAKRQQG